MGFSSDHLNDTLIMIHLFPKLCRRESEAVNGMTNEMDAASRLFGVKHFAGQVFYEALENALRFGSRP